MTATFSPYGMSTDLNATLAERGSRYGKFADHARVTQNSGDHGAVTEVAA